MSNRITFNPRYKSLFRNGGRTRYTVISAGRASGKSYAVSAALVNDTYNDGFNTLFTRYTMVAAHDSIIPEFNDKIELFQLDADFNVLAQDVENTRTGASIMFRGLMVSSKNQIARLKSISKVKRFIIDEAQELVDEDMFDTIDFSIRTTEADNEIWIIWNPTDVHHWIYRKFFKDAGVDITFNGIKGDVTYIYTTYEQNRKNLDESFLAQAEKMKAKNYKKYENVFLGIPMENKEGQIYHWNYMPESEWGEDVEWLSYGVDWGYTNDPTAVVRVGYSRQINAVYFKQVMYRKQCQPRDVVKAVSADMQGNGIRNDLLVYCDPARPEHIAELRNGGINAVKGINKNKAGRISFLQGFTVYYDGEDIGKEADGYCYKPHPQDKTTFTNEPMDGDDHLMDACSYGGVTHLRRIGVANDYGEG